MSPKLLILGASARAAAWSARRAGYAVVAADLFADCDLQGMAVAHRVTRYPDQLASMARQLSADAWLYTGGLENHPALVDRVAAWHTLWGNAGDVLRRVRDPGQVLQALRDEGLPSPDIRFDPSHLGRDGSWLCKPLDSCGGCRIQRVEPGWAPDAKSGPSYYQQYVEGEPHAAVYVAAAGQSRLLGVTRQWIGTCWSGASRFGYAGSCGPVPLAPAEQADWQRIGRCLSRSFGLRGLFGVDAIRSHGQIMPVEVNPRYTASVEVIERATGLEAIALHADASSSGRLPADISLEQHRCRGKGVLYASDDTQVSDQFSAEVARINRSGSGCMIADIPATGQRIGRGRPVVSMLIEAGDPRQAESQLQRLAVHLRSLLPREAEAAPPDGLPV